MKNAAQVRANDAGGRFGPKSRVADMYTSMYVKESMLQALDEWENIAKDAGITKVALAYRWVSYHSALNKENGDAIIVGASKVEQLEETLKVLEDGPLAPEIVGRVEAIWKTVEHEAPLDNYHSYLALK